MTLHDLLEQMRNQFSPFAIDRDIDFEIISEVSTGLSFETDGQRVMQIMKNLLSNAFNLRNRVIFRNNQ